jgi:large subunit ribosomal protein L21
MYAVIASWGKQYKVTPGDIVRIESLMPRRDDTIEIKDVYLIADGDKISVGKPVLTSAKVTAEVIAREEERSLSSNIAAERGIGGRMVIARILRQ